MKKSGIGAIKGRQAAQERFRDKQTVLQESELAQLNRNLDSFREKLEKFAADHRNEIRKDPVFRQQFQNMCADIGVDPLASSKGFWAEKLGVGEFYYELSVQIVEVCMALAYRTGGLMPLEDLRTRVIKSRGGREAQNITSDDLLRAIAKLKVLGNGFTVIPSGKSFLIQSVPRELTLDHTQVLQLAEKVDQNGRIFFSDVRSNLNWSLERVEKAFDDLLREGLVWIDRQELSESAKVSYWVIGLFRMNETCD
ncbi:unnamed protein product [Notodromas monacha]|uniref:Vacuolar-sorting protein SNF8 n=1 Tax=Notodromas monacha TaxID=399045 RepID=A0A7R9BIW2_9CRUS|nr:unnamed protein product [Notodromas monacha]CAG0914757.1 unnamed protein product [Notodromas monacha]